MRSYTGIGAAALSLLSFAIPGSAFFRVPCPGRIVTERADPIVSPGSVAGHVHTISGGNGFGFTESYEQARTSTCSSCPIKQDLSNYWTPALYYQHENGSFESVPQSGDGVGVYGGMTVYWLQRGGPNNDNLTAYPEGFRMLAGDPFKRAPTKDFAGEAISFVCLDYSGTSGYFNHLPNTTCPDGLRAQVFFPSCWDGVNLDSSDHKSHMAYPTKYSYDNGPCPASHPVHMISLFYEVIWSTAGFEWWNGTTQPFVFAMGDPLGYGFHGDFINGWDVDVLQNATDNCFAESGLPSDCDVFEFFTTAESEACIIAPEVDEQITGLLDALPGCNPVTWGPDEAPSHYANCPVTNISAAKTYYTNVTDWVYLGCGSDNETSRTFNGSTYSSSSMTVESCLAYCQTRGYHYAGLEYGDQCFCGNNLPEKAAPVEGVLGNCITTCHGNSSEYCGGGLRLSMYYTDTVANVTSCPAGNWTTYTSPYNNENFFVECGFNYGGTNMGMLYPGNGIQGCIDACANTTGCMAVSLSGTACYLKSNIGTLSSSTSVHAAKRIVAGSSSSSSVSSSTSATSSASGSSTKTASFASSSTSGTSSASGSASKTSSTVSAASSSSSVAICPNLNATNYTDPATGSTFFIECGIDHSGGDLSMTYVKNMAGCISACANTAGCVDVSLSGTACYMKKSVGAAVSNGVAGARLLAASSSSVLSSATSATSSSNIPSASSVSSSVTSAILSSKTSSASSVSSSTASTGSSSKTSSASSVSSSTASTGSSSKTSSASSVSSATFTASSSKISSSSSVSSSSSSSSSTTSTTPSATIQNKAAATTSVVPLCPNLNSTIYTEPITGHNFTIECGIDHAGGDLKMVYTANLTACIGVCANTTGCVDVSYSGSACYMKSSVGTAVYNGVKGARLMASTSSSSSSVSTSVTVRQNVAAASSKTSSTSTSSKATSTSSSSSTRAASTSSKTSTLAKRAAVTNT